MSKQHILVIDIGGISVKLVLCSDPAEPVTVSRFPTPAFMTPQQLVEGVRQIARDWQYQAVSIGYPGPVKNNQVWREPVNLGAGWTDFDFKSAFACPVKLINDAAMQALGSYRGDDMLFLGLGTGLGTALIRDGQIIPLEVAHLPYRDGMNFEQALGKQGLDQSGYEVWYSDLLATIDLFAYALCTDYVVLGGGNANLLKEKFLPDNIHIGDNNNAFTGGLLLWSDKSTDDNVIRLYAS
jgi:predicted NBD/HSP70 family sugar kinase